MMFPYEQEWKLERERAEKAEAKVASLEVVCDSLRGSEQAWMATAEQACAELKVLEAEKNAAIQRFRILVNRRTDELPSVMKVIQIHGGFENGDDHLCWQGSREEHSHIRLPFWCFECKLSCSSRDDLDIFSCEREVSVPVAIRDQREALARAHAEGYEEGKMAAALATSSVSNDTMPRFSDLPLEEQNKWREQAGVCSSDVCPNVDCAFPPEHQGRCWISPRVKEVCSHNPTCASPETHKLRSDVDRANPRPNDPLPVEDNRPIAERLHEDCGICVGTLGQERFDKLFALIGDINRTGYNIGWHSYRNSNPELPAIGTQVHHRLLSSFHGEIRGYKAYVQQDDGVMTMADLELLFLSPAEPDDI